MSAEFQLYKYTGNDSSFGTPVSSIGLKRIDAAVPAVYGNPIVPGDDTSDVNTYPVYRSDNPDESVYSFESVFKLILTVAPSNQLSNVRIYPEPYVDEFGKEHNHAPNDPYLPKLSIGNSISYTRPTNDKSDVALNHIWDYTKENPFLLTVNGNYGQQVEEQINELNYNVTLNDIGFGNIIYLNDVRQDSPPVVVGNTYQFINRETGQLDFTIFDPSNNTAITGNPDITTTVDIEGNQIVTINCTEALMTSYPNGFLYGDLNDISIGGFIQWLDLGTDPVEVVEYDVEVMLDCKGKPVYYLNGVRSPQLNFLENRIYQFNNHSGSTDPLRFLNNCESLIANQECEIVINGVEVMNGATDDEVIVVDPSEVKMAGDCIRSYQSTRNTCLGNCITNTNTSLVGNYNIDTVCGGIANPMAAGETDFVYVQLEVTGESTVGQVVPNLIIEYDES
jgi:hypothetical protein